MKSIDGEGEDVIYWFTKDSSRMIKMETKPGTQMGGGTVLLELGK